MKPALLRHAARVIEEEATLHRESCQILKGEGKRPLEWACSGCSVETCRTKKRYDELKQLAKDLRKEARAA